MDIIFSEASNVNGSIYGNCQAPIKMFIEQRGEAMERDSMLKHLFCMGTSDNYGDLYTGMTAMDGFKPVGENGAYPSDGMQEGRKKLLVYETWKDSFAISAEMIEDAKLMEMRKQPAGFMRGYQRTREHFGAALYAGAMQGKKTVAFRGKNFDIACSDELPLFHGGHPALVNGETQSNCFSAEFNAVNLGKVETAMQNFRGENNEILDVAPTTILIPNDADAKQAVFAAIGADKDPDTANNGCNYQFGRWRVITWNYLNQYLKAAATFPWILLDGEFNEQYGGAPWNDRVQLAVRSIIDEGNDANVWKGRSRYNATFNDWRYAAIGGINGATDI